MQAATPVTRLREIMGGSRMHWALFVLIIGLGLYARTWEYRTLTSGLNHDEASTGIDAMSLYRYGTDRHGVSLPVRFISWGSGQDVLYGYVLVPLIAVLGLAPTVVRLPMLVSAILTLLLIYYIGRRLRGPEFGLLAMFLLAISPWHIAISRRAVDTNLAPFLFLLGFACLLKTDRTNRWFVVACLVFGIWLYAYWTSYLILPLFLLIAVPSLYAAGRISIKDLVAGIVLLALLAVPAGLYILINTLELPSIHLGPLTVPRFPSVSRISTEVAVFQPGALQHLLQNTGRLLGMIIIQNNEPGGTASAGFPYGYLYRFSFPLILAGAVILLKGTADPVTRRLLIAWLVSTAVLGLMISPLFVHINVLILALILCCAASLEWLLHWNKVVFLLSLALFLAAFGMFTGYMHSTAYRDLVQREYREGLLPALDYARSSTTGPICVISNKILQPEVFVLFSEKMAPSVGPAKVVFADPAAQFQKARSVGRYFFDSEDCPAYPSATYVMFYNEPPPVGASAFTTQRFALFKVLVPK